ncbi:uncharacterized protein EV420DRAFT_1649601 [Desarmillaria tabescens]|uniref:HNH nuclease domain-containing protein n=1 Tax=Armillaria tabescens TaxID=1929756 RepID=A0AA39MQN7_ARMTA|nr:uncharacterized protein EV420DRAFT_1649601 [Desarmillaria tabescens]KAK0442713.1 hypothetical protein EV420DRAFT_1649601 [Desarmillaria tabescens]
MATPEQRCVRLYVLLRGPDNAPASEFWLPCLEIPIDRLTELLSKPYRWLCYAGYCIMGVEGSLSFSSTDLGRAGGPIIPIDPDFEDGTVTTLSENRSSTFRTSIVERDGTCVAVDDPPFVCEAAHLIGHNKGSEYIERFTQRRGGGDVVTCIDDPRTGLLVNKIFHIVLGRSVAILPTPNFIMKTTDVVQGTAPDEARWTVQDFAEPRVQLEPRISVSAFQLVRPSAYPPISQLDTWPPQCLFAAVYASALITTWPVDEFLTQVRSMWTNSFYPGGKAISDQRKAERKSKVQKSIRNEQEDEVDVFDVLLMLQDLSAYNTAGNPISQHSSAQKAMEEAQEKVGPWLQNVH